MFFALSCELEKMQSISSFYIRFCFLKNNYGWNTYIDTADMYGDSEDLLEKYFKKYPQQRQKVFISISTKKKEHPFLL